MRTPLRQHTDHRRCDVGTTALSMKTVGELRKLAAAKGIPRANNLRKHQLLSALDDPKSRQNLPVFGKEPPLAPSSSTMTVMVLPRAPSSSPMAAQPPVGLPIPDQYGTTRLVLMPQEPHRLFAYWMVDAERMAAVKHACPHGWRPALLLVSNGGIEQREIELRSGNAYLSVVPGRSYKAALAIRDVDGTLHHLISSNRVTMPTDSFAPETEANAMNVRDPFCELCELAAMKWRVPSGNSSDRLDERDADRMRLKAMLPLGVSSTFKAHH